MSKNDDFDFGMYIGKSALLRSIAYAYLGYAAYMPKSNNDKKLYPPMRSAFGQEYLSLEDAIGEFLEIIKKNKNEQKFGIWTDPYIPKEYADIETDYVAREAVRSEIYHNQSCLNEYQLDTLPAADVKPVKRGEWEKGRQRGILGNEYKCSFCSYQIIMEEKDKYNYCPNCGADMREIVK